MNSYISMGVYPAGAQIPFSLEIDSLMAMTLLPYALSAIKVDGMRKDPREQFKGEDARCFVKSVNAR